MMDQENEAQVTEEDSAQKVRKSNDPNALTSGYNRSSVTDLQLQLSHTTPQDKIPFLPSKAGQYYI